MEEYSNFKIVKVMKSMSKPNLNQLLLSITSNDKYWRSQLHILHLRVFNTTTKVIMKRVGLWTSQKDQLPLALYLHPIYTNFKQSQVDSSCWWCAFLICNFAQIWPILNRINKSWCEKWGSYSIATTIWGFPHT